MGWFKWPEVVAYATDVNVILIAMQGTEDFLVIQGILKPRKKKLAELKPTEVAERFRAYVAEHNETFRSKR